MKDYKASLYRGTELIATYVVTAPDRHSKIVEEIDKRVCDLASRLRLRVVFDESTTHKGVE